ncbi:juxtaposed with another zinc finger protein 1 [Spodoptera frugiperda]|uniref:Juxtaposed with another zinc finger protein 1 n=1 Tax=Spodoptera frugiperda TaxID=7108 RepID=A0A9R0F5R9_SPOFR|nr:juxtaposed with another zinc finger protein 1 [Spodoptera frugiperda]
MSTVLPLTSAIPLYDMAVFMINICKFNGCGITFPRLADLIEHIEDVHIDYDPAVIEQKEASQPACIPLSYVLKFISEASKRENQNTAPAPDVRRRLLSAPKTPSVRSSTPTGSEMDEDELVSPSEDSNDSWTTAEEYSSEFILRYGVKMNASASSGALGPAAQEKPFACPVPGCKKRYKNVNGIKYHSKNGHKKDGKVKKGYRCPCGKSYKTAQGLKSHSITQHIASSQPSTSEHKLHAAKMTGLVVTSSPAQSRTLNLLDAVDGNKLVRIYDSLKGSLPKPAAVSVAPGSGVLATSVGLLGAAGADKLRLERAPKVSAPAGHAAHVASVAWPVYGADAPH